MVWLTGRLQMLPSRLHSLHFHSLLLHLHLLHLHLWLKLPSKDWSLRTKGIFCQSVAVHSVGLDWNVLRKSTCVVTNCPGTRCFLWISFDQQLQQTLDFLQVCNWSPSNMDNCSSSYKPTFRCHLLSNVILLYRPHLPVYHLLLPRWVRKLKVKSSIGSAIWHPHAGPVDHDHWSRSLVLKNPLVVQPAATPVYYSFPFQ